MNGEQKEPKVHIDSNMQLCGIGRYEFYVHMQPDTFKLYESDRTEKVIKWESGENLQCNMALL